MMSKNSIIDRRRWTVMVAAGAAAVLAGSVGGCSDVTGPALSGPFVGVATGAEHSCAVQETGQAYCWGAGDLRQLGRESTADSPTPVPVEGGHRFMAVTAGYSHTCGLTPEGRAICWGSNVLGQLGLGGNYGVPEPAHVAGDLRFNSISAGWYHTCATTVEGMVYCWGAGDQGQLGNDDIVAHFSPVAIAGDLRFRQVSAGAHHTCGVTLTGEAYCWGLNHLGQLGDGSTASSVTPQAVAGGGVWLSVAAGATHSCGVRQGGEMHCWGSNAHGELGNRGLEREGVPGSTTPAPVTEGITFVSVAAGRNFSCGVSAEGRAYCWGYGLDGQIGNGFRMVHAVPQYLAAPSGSGADQLVVHAIDLGLRHACALTTANSIYCWGDGRRGALGSPAVRQSVVPVRVRRGN
jgi:alpha-tubulin suppressor-like RCC1 family protein